jgi:hypothetical protein
MVQFSPKLNVPAYSQDVFFHSTILSYKLLDQIMEAEHSVIIHPELTGGKNPQFLQV